MHTRIRWAYELLHTSERPCVSLSGVRAARNSSAPVTVVPFTRPDSAPSGSRASACHCEPRGRDKPVFEEIRAGEFTPQKNVRRIRQPQRLSNPGLQFKWPAKWTECSQVQRLWQGLAIGRDAEIRTRGLVVPRLTRPRW